MAKIRCIIISIIGIASGIILLLFIGFRFKLTIHDSSKFDKHRVILVVLDAFRHDYPEIAKHNNLELPNLKALMRIGARIKQMEPVFPSLTMPNHQALVTGLFSPYHGITSNSFNDSSMNYDRFAMSNQSSLNEARWYSGYPDPIWVSCERLANCQSGSMLWPNTDAPVNGYRPSRSVSQYIVLNEQPNIYPYDRRVDEMLSWITKDLIDFGLLYFDEPDPTSHKYGPLHKKTLDVVVAMDRWIGRLVAGIRAAGLADRTDVIVTADHGMTMLSEDRVINIDQFVPPQLYRSTYSYPVGIIYPNKGEEQKVYNLYKNASSHIKVYWREELPEKFHYKENAHRVSPIVTIVDLGWIVNSSHYWVKMKYGHHGYDQESDDMKAFFVAAGPSFKNVVIENARHVDLYPLLNHLLGMTPNPNNGSFSRISQILKESAKVFRPREGQWNYDKVYLLVIGILLLQITGCLVHILHVIYVTICSRGLRRKRQPDTAYYDKKTSEALISIP